MDQNPETFKLVINQALANGAAFSDLRANIDGDGDFVALNIWGTSDGAYSIKFRNSQFKDMASAEASNANSIGTAQFPVPFGGIRYPKLGQISFSITNLYAGTNNVQIVIEGYRMRQ